MPQKDTPAKFVLSTDPMLANVGDVTDDKFELVFIYGHIGKLTDDTVCLHQGLDLRRRYEIPRREIVHVTISTCTEGDMSKVVLYSTTRITYVSGNATATLPASALAGFAEASNKKVLQPDACPQNCMCNGKCKCASSDYWLKLDDDTAKKLGVVVSKASSGTK
jgi:hypothetical protein